MSPCPAGRVHSLKAKTALSCLLLYTQYLSSGLAHSKHSKNIAVDVKNLRSWINTYYIFLYLFSLYYIFIYFFIHFKTMEFMSMCNSLGQRLLQNIAPAFSLMHKKNSRFNPSSGLSFPDHSNALCPC